MYALLPSDLPQSDLSPSRRWWIKTLLINVSILIIFAGVIQLIPVSRDNPPVQREPVWDTPETRALAQTACFDCHSNETNWPWYARLAPVSWGIWYDVTEGREDLNFSEWARHLDDDMVDPNDPFPPKTISERIEDEIRNGTMPPGTYRLLHPEARLSDAEKDALITGLLYTIQQSQE